MAAKIIVVGLILSSYSYLRSAVVRCPLQTVNSPSNNAFPQQVRECIVKGILFVVPFNKMLFENSIYILNTFRKI